MRFDPYAKLFEERVIFLGVHFMAESADILTAPHVQVILPDLAAGCSMADMADLGGVEECWSLLQEVAPDDVVPLTYMNSSADIKAFCGRHDGVVCTSSNAQAVLEWAFEQKDDAKVLFFPDQHLGRNTAYDMGFTETDMRVWNPRFDLGGLEERDVKESKFLLWKGHCSVHQRFTVDHVAAFRAEHPTGEVIVHPECAHEVVELADKVGSTERIMEWVAAAPAGSVIGVGTEIHMIQRLAAEHPDKTVVSLDPLVCPCSTMFRIDAAHLAWVLENLVKGRVVNPIRVDTETSEWAKVALKRMLRTIIDEIDHRFMLQADSRVLEITQTEDAWQIKTPAGALYVLPKVDVIPLPIDNTTAERLAEWFNGRVWQSLMHRRAANVRCLTIEVSEGPDQKASYRRDRLPLG